MDNIQVVQDAFGLNDSPIVEDDFGTVKKEKKAIPEEHIKEMAGLQAIYNNENDETLLQDYNKHYNNFQRGDLSNFNMMLDTIQDEYNTADREAFEEDVLLDNTLLPEDKIEIGKELVATTPKAAEELESQAAIKQIESFILSGDTREDVERRIDLYKRTNNIFQRIENNNKKIVDYLSSITPSGGEIATGVGQILVPPVAIVKQHIPTYRVASDLIEKYSNKVTGIQKRLSPGGMAEELNTIYHMLPEDEKSIFIKDLNETIDEHKGAMGFSPWTKYMLAAEVLRPRSPIFNWDKFWNNTAFAFDSMLLGMGMGRVAMLGKAAITLTSVGNSVIRNPFLAAKVGARVLWGGDEGRVISKAINLKAEDIIIDGLPRVPVYNKSISKDAPYLLKSSLNQIRAEEIAAAVSDLNLYSKEEQLIALGRIADEQQADGLILGESILKPAREIDSKLNMTREGLVIEGVWGKNGIEGFSNKWQARAFARKHGFDPEKVEEIGFQWYAKETTFHPYNLDDAGFFPDGALRVLGKKAKFFSDDLTKFTEEIARPFQQAADKSHFIEEQLTKAAKPFFKLKGNASKRKVNELLISDSMRVGADGKPGVRTPVEHLLQAGWTKAEIAAREAHRETQNLLYMVNNIRKRNRFVAEGQRTISNGAYETMAKPIKAKNQFQIVSDENRVRILNPETKTISVLGKEDIAKIYDEGSYVAKFKIPEIHGDDTVDFILISKASKTKNTDIPFHVLKYRRENFTRRYKDRWFIKRTRLTGKLNIKDEKVLEVLETAPSRKDAVKAIERLRKQYGDNFGYFPEQDKNFLRGHFSAADSDAVDHASGQLYFSHKKLRPLGDTDRIADPFESLTQTITHVSRRAAWEQTLEKSKKNYMNTYGDLSKHRYPTTVDKIAGPSITDRRVREAQAYWEHIHMLENTQDEFASTWRYWAQLASEFVESKSDKKWATNLARGIETIGDVSPFGVMKSAAFLRFLGGFPTRQYILQSSQPIMLALLEPRYMTWNFWRDKNVLDMGMLLVNDPKNLRLYAKSISKISDLSESDVMSLVQTFWRTGIRQSVRTGNIYKTGMVQEWSRGITNNLFQSGKKTFNNLAVAPIKASSIGFNLGEQNNLMANWLIATERVRKKTGKSFTEIYKDKNLVDHIHYKARGIGLNMSETGMFAWQKNPLFLSLQFQAINFKSFLMLAGKNQALQGADLNKVRLMSLMAYGAEGFGIGRLTHYLDEGWNAYIDDKSVMPTGLKIAVSGGLMNWGLYTLFGVQMDAAQSLAATSGAAGERSWGTIIRDAVTGKKNFFEIMGGASLQTAMDGIGVLSTIYSIAKTHNWDDPELPLDFALAWGQFFPQISKASQAYTAISTGYYLSKHNSPVVRAIPKEAYIMAVTGVQPSAKNDAWWLLAETQFTEREVKKDGEAFFQFVYDDVIREQLAKKEWEDLDWQIFNKGLELRIAQLENFPEKHKQKVWDYFNKKVWNEYKVNKGLFYDIEVKAEMGDVYEDKAALYSALAKRGMKASKTQEEATNFKKFLDVMFEKGEESLDILFGKPEEEK